MSNDIDIQQGQELLTNYRANPDKFVSQVLRRDLWHMQATILRDLAVPNARVAVKACHSVGKGLSLDTFLPTPSGWTTMGDVAVGDTLFDESGNPCAVTYVSPIHHITCYRVTFDDGTFLTVDKDHLWSVLQFKKRNMLRQRYYAKDSIIVDWRNHWNSIEVVSTPELQVVLKTPWGQGDASIPINKPLILPTIDLPVDPYVLGAWLGDGTTLDSSITCGDKDILDEIEKIGWKASVQPSRVHKTAPTYRLRPSTGFGVTTLRKAGVIGNKHIPLLYLRASIEQRLALLQGIMDTDGFVHVGGAGVDFGNEKLTNDVAELIRSLGWKVNITQGVIKCQTGSFTRYRMYFVPDLNVFRLPRKRDKLKLLGKYRCRSTHRFVVSVEEVNSVPTKCLTVNSPNNLFLAGKAMIPTHNTQISSDAVIWHTATGGITLTTAPSWTQVETQLWGYIHRTFQDVGDILGGELLKVEWKVGPHIFARGLSTNEGVRFQGFHGHILVILDEATGVRPDIWEAIEGIRAGGDVRVLALGNPTVASGPFFDAFRNPNSGWTTHSISAFDTPNLQGLTLDDLLAMDPAPGGPLDYNVREYLTKRRWVYEKYYDWGTDSPLWFSRVMGEFPPQSDDSLISLGWIDAARHRTPVLPDIQDFVAGIDVAGPGENETVCVVRHGPKIVDMRSWTKPDPRADLTQMLAYWQHRSSGYKSLKVNIDAAGNGWYLYLHLKDKGFDVTPVNVGSAVAGEPENKAKYANLKAQLYWQLRETFRDGNISGVKDDLLMGQLAALRYREDDRGRIRIEDKDSMQKRGVPSPDRAEALMLAYSEIPAEPTRLYTPVLIHGTINGGWTDVNITPFVKSKRKGRSFR